MDDKTDTPKLPPEHVAMLAPLVRFLARQAAERDFREEMQKRIDINSSKIETCSQGLDISK